MKGPGANHPLPDAGWPEWPGPEAILAGIGLEKGDVFVEPGCGDGFFTIPAARLVGDKGRVYGLDVSQQAIERLKARAAGQGLANLVLRVGRAEDTLLGEAFADFIFFGRVLHDFADPARVLANAARMAKPGGLLADLDFKKESAGFGPPRSVRFTEAEASSLIEAAGFSAETVRDVGPHFYLVTARR